MNSPARARRSDSPVRICVWHPEANAAPAWVERLRAALPDALVDLHPMPENAQAAVVWQPPADFFERHPGLRVVFATGAGVDSLLSHPGLPAALPVVRLEDAGMGRQMAEYCCHEVLRRHRAWDRYEAHQREHRWHEIEPAPPGRFTVGVLGMGVLGRQVAATLAGLGYRVLGYSRSAPADDASRDGAAARASATDAPAVERYHGEVQLPAFLAQCQMLILLVPLTPHTRDLMNAQRLALLPDGAWLVNVARGALVVDEDLLAALESGRLAGATLDVFREEPLPPAHRFWDHPRIRVTPHIAAPTLVEEGAVQVAANIRAMQTGGVPGGLVDRGRGY